MKKTIKGFKAFHKDMKCQGFQFKEGKTYEHPGIVKCCPDSEGLKAGAGGFHFCTDPWDVLNYYPLTDSEFSEVESLSEAKTAKNKDDSKIATSKIKIGAKLGLSGFIKASVDFLLNITKEKTESGDSAQIGSSGDSAKIGSSGYFAKIGSSGYSAQIGSSGDSAKIGSSGYFAQIGSSGDSAQIGSLGDSAQIELNGEDSVGMCAGSNTKMKGKKGNWITLAEWKWDEKKNRHITVWVKSTKIDGKKIKEDVWYQLKNKKFVEIPV